MGRSLDELDPRFRPKVEAALSLLVAREVPHLLFCTGRSAAEQADAFRRGASRCDGVRIKSNHQLGLAADIVALNSAKCPTWNYRKYVDVYMKIGLALEECGLEWGGSWFPSEYDDVGLGWDPPHGEYKE
jgi:hypothetical protein